MNYNYKERKIFKPSKYKVCHNNYFNKVRAEAQMRQVVTVSGRHVMFGVEGPIILSEGRLWFISAEVEGGRWGKHWIMVAPDLPTVLKQKKCFIRIDSGCMSGFLGDITCDCFKQLQVAQLEALKQKGIVIYIPNQDGRGHGEFKMANQRLMYDCKMDTIAVARRFYGSQKKVDIRTFDEVIIILKALGFLKGYKFNLGTKNPKKVQAFLKAGFVVDAHEVKINNKSRLLNKNLKAKHQFFEKEKKIYATNKER